MLDVAELGSEHWKIWSLSAMGVFLDGFDLFIIGVALPLIVKDMKPSPGMEGMIGAAAVLGAMIGAFFGGKLTDRFGRKAIYIVDLAFFIIFSLLTAFAWNPLSLVVLRFLLGIGVGADYPICASYVSEFMPARMRGRMLIGAFSFQALGMLAAALTGLVILKFYPHLIAWRWMLGIGAVPALLVMVLRATVPESARWYLEHGHTKKAAKVIALLVPAKKSDIEKIMLKEEEHLEKHKAEQSYSTLFSAKYIRRTVLASGAWFLMDIATYAVGIFTPTILAAMAFDITVHGRINRDFKATQGAAFLDLFLIVGFLLNVWLVDKWGRINLQILGFAGMTVGLLALGYAAGLEAAGTQVTALVFFGFILFNILMNMGPNATTFILPAELFSTRVRASGHGFASACAKLGAAIGIFFLPLVRSAFGTANLLYGLAGVTLAGLLITVFFRVETRGRSLEEIDPGEV